MTQRPTGESAKENGMHIEPGLVAESKIWLSYLTAAGAGAYSLKLAADAVRERGVVSLAARTVATTALVFGFFEILPHHPVGVSEVHLILGSTLFLIFGAAPAALGLAFGLLIQGLFFAPFDLPQYGMNVTTLLVPLFAVAVLARRVIAPDTAYVDLRYGQALALSTAYQAGIVGWVAFWALYGQGFAAANLTAVASFGAAYLLVIVVEPLVDLAVLAGAKTMRGLTGSGLVERRLFHTA
jgi:ABC-type Co2+ transport system permease subunit